jgi:hypothetical protein
MALTESFVKEHIDKWISAWNTHDLKAILSLYSEDIEFRSPKIKSVYSDRFCSQGKSYNIGISWYSRQQN